MKKSFFTTLIFLWSAVFLSLQAQDCSAPAAPYVQWSGCNKIYANLSGADLSGANLSGADLYGVNLSGANLTDANLTGARLSDATLTGANLTNANLSGADLTRANLSNANLSGANLTDANPSVLLSSGITGTPSALPANWQLINGYLVGPSANLANANLANMNLVGMNISGANLSGANLSGANLSSASLMQTNLNDANLSDANLSGANVAYAGLQGANLTGANFTSANMYAANLVNADLSNANLTGVFLLSANLTGANLTGVVSGGINGIPYALPTGWQLINGYLVGPGANLANANLANMNLVGVNISGANLSGANLSGANLSGAILFQTNLNDANLSDANLSGATVDQTFLQGANLTNANMTGANMGGAHFDNANLSNANLTGANLLSATLTGTNLSGANLSDTQLSGTNMSGAILTGAILTGAQVTNSNLADVNLAGANLSGLGTYDVYASLYSSDLTGANLTGADLTNMDLRNINISGADLTGAILTGVGSGGITGTPYALPTDWQLINGYLVGPLTVTFDANGGATPSPETISVIANATYGTLATASRPCYAFNGWFTERIGGTEITSTSAVGITSNQTLYAQWTAINYNYTEPIVACGSYEWHGNTYTSSNNTATWTGTNAAGCDSIVTLNLTINPLPVVSVGSNPANLCVGGTSQLIAVVAGTIEAPTYCTSNLSISNDCSEASLTNVTIAGTTLNNNPVCNIIPGNGNYTAYAATGNTTAVLAPGQTYTISVSTAGPNTPGFTGDVSMFIDYNRNGQFEPAEWTQVYTNAIVGTASFTVPSNASLGATGMRVRSRQAFNTNGATDACLTFASGSTNDYIITIMDTSLYSFNWVGSSSTHVSNSTVYNPVATLTSSSDTYTVTVSELASGCTSTGSVTIQNIPVSAVSLTLGGANSCVGTQTVSAAPTGGPAPFTYSWTEDGVAFGTNAATITTSAGTHVYACTLTDNCGSSASSSLSVTTHSLATITPASVVLCGGNPVIATAGPAGATYSWSGGLGNAQTATLNASGDYTVTVTQGNCVTSATASARVTSSPAITASSNSPVCEGGALNLTSTGVVTQPVAGNYSVESIAYAPVTPETAASAGPAGDDVVSGAIPIGFNFTYYGITYTNVYVSTNGFISFNPSSSFISQALPDANNPNAVIALDWMDLDTRKGGTIDYFNLTSPNRFVVRFNNVATYNVTGTVSGEIILYPSGIIEIHNSAITTTGSNQTQGIENSTGTLATTVPGRNNTAWNATADAFRFSPPIATGETSYAWTGPNAFSVQNPSIASASSTDSGTYTVTFTDPFGCTASTTVDAVVNPASSSTEPIVACGSYEWHGNTYTSSNNTATWTGTNAAGCDSIVTLNLTINQPSYTTETIVACSSYEWHGTTYTSSTNNTGGIFGAGAGNLPTWTGTNAAGCDSIVTLNLTINQPSYSTEPIVACGSYEWHGNTYTSSNNTATWTGTNAAGCDSTVTLNLTINQPSYTTEPIVACGSYEWHGTTYTSSNNSATWTGTNAAGCDSIVTLNLTVNDCEPPVINCPSSLVINNCNSFLTLGDPTITDNSGSFENLPILNSNLSFDGVNDFVNTMLDVSETAFTVEMWFKTNQTNGGIFMVKDGGGAYDRTVILTNGNIEARTYDDETIVTSGTNYADNNWHHLAFVLGQGGQKLYVDGILKASGIKSASDFHWQDRIAIGKSFSSPSAYFSGKITEFRIWNAARTQAEIIANMNARINPQAGLAVCYHFNEGDLSGNNIGRTTAHDGSGNGNDGTLLNFDLTGSSSNWFNSVTNDAPATFPFGTTLVNWTAQDLAGNTSTCTQTVTIVNNVSYTTEPIVACGSYEWHGNTYTSSNNTATWTGQNAAGCDSIVTLNLTINQPSYSTEPIVACGSYEWHGNTYTSSNNTATWTGTNAAGCDSIVTLNLTINALPTLAGTLNPAAICNNTAFTYTPTSETAGATFTWTRAEETGISNAAVTTSQTTNPNEILVNTTAAAIDVVYAYTTLAPDGCTNTQNVTVTVNPSFSQLSTSITAVIFGKSCWADFDNDDDLDVLVSGQKSDGSFVTEIWTNTGGVYTQLNTSITGVVNGSVEGGDYDNDGDLDVLLSGGKTDGSYVTEIWTNTGGSFSQLPTSITGAAFGRSTWGDYDNDGDLDVLLTGRGISEIWTNTGGSFSQLTTSISAGLNYGNVSVDWGDYDNDGDLDFLLSGFHSGGSYNEIWTNTGGTFSKLTTPIRSLYRGSAVWGDYDNDGDLDIVVDGYGNALDPRVNIWTNNGGGNFSRAGNYIYGVAEGSASWGDYDNDGDLDLLASGSSTGDAGSAITHINTNNGGYFSNSSIPITGISLGNSLWGDYDNDGDLDILLSGMNGDYQYVTEIWTNNRCTFNTAPVAPTDLAATQTSCNEATLTWSKTTDTQTSQNGLAYNIRIGTAANGIQKLSPMANVTNGYRSIASIAKVQWSAGGYTVTGLTPGTYYWSVQATDAALAGGEWATEGTFTIGGPTTSTEIITACSSYDWHGTTYTSSNNTATWTGTNAAGCDSIVSLDLTINQPSYTTETIVACGSYEWHGNTYTSSNNTATWTGTNAAGCDSIVTLNLTINPLPTPAISGTLAFCAGGSTTLDAGAGYSSYLWSTGETTQTISVSSTTPVSVTVTHAAGCSATSASVTPTANAVSTAPTSISSSVAFATSGTNFTLSVNGGSLGTGATWKWYTGSCGGTLVGTGASISVSQTANTTYFVRAEGTCNTTACATITVDSFCGATGVTSSAGTTAICAGSPVTLTVIGSLSPGAQWSWDDECDNYDDGTNTTVSTFTVSPNSTKTYYVRSVGGACGLTACVPITVNVIAKPATPGTINGSASVCPSTSVTYTIAAVSGATSYTWTAPTNATLVSAQGGTSMTVAYAGTFTSGTLKVKANNCSGSSSDKSLSVAKQTAPAAPASIAGSASVCPSTSVTYTIAAVTNATSYTWVAPANATLASAQGGTSMTINYGSAFVSGTLSVTAVGCGGTSAAKTLSITKFAVPATPGTISGNATPCKNSTQTYSIAAVTGATSYTWALPTGVTFVTGSSQTGTSIQVVVASTFTTGTLSVRAVNCGGSSSLRTLSLTGNSAPTAPGTITGPSSVTQNTANNTFSVSNVAGMTYNWTVPAGCTITLGQGTSTIKVTWGTVAGTVSVTRNNGCGNSVASTKSVSVKRSEEAEADAGMESARTEETVETMLTATDALNAIAVYPNPTTGEARITFSTTAAGKYSLSIVDLQGRVINSTSGAAIEGNNTLDINLSNCSNGVYMIHLMHNDTLQTLRVVKM